MATFMVYHTQLHVVLELLFSSGWAYLLSHTRSFTSRLWLILISILCVYFVFLLVTLIFLIVVSRYCRWLEEGSFRGRAADFVMMFVFGAVCMITYAFFVNPFFLGQVNP